MADTSASTTKSQNPRTSPLRVLIIDAHPAVGLGLRRLIGIMPGIEVCGLAARGDDGLKCADLTPPDVALVDAELPNDAGLDTIRRLRDGLPTTRVVALGLYTSRRSAALAAGAHTFVLKDAGFDALRAAIVAETAGAISNEVVRPSDSDRRDRDLASAQTPRSAS
jgi:DNA-binding NarL/FixJ family response regulator